MLKKSIWASLLVAALAAVSVGPAASAEIVSSPRTADAPDRGTRLILLGTAGGPNIRTDRSQPANLLIVDGRPYLIDCGEGTVEQLRKAGFHAADISRVFLTHLHLDHVGGLASLMGFRWTAGSVSQPIEVYGPPGTEKLTAGAASYLSVSEHLFAAVLPPRPSITQMSRARDLHVTGQQLVYSDDKIRVFAVENSHFSAVRLGADDYGVPRSYSYRIETPDRTFVFTGDTGPSAALTALARNADVLVSEVIDIDRTLEFMKAKYRDSTQEMMADLVDHQKREHLIPEEVGRLAAEAKARMVVLTHIVPGTDDERSSLNYVAGVRRAFGGVVVAGKDLDEF